MFKLLCVKAHDSSGQCNVCLCGVAASSLPLPSPIPSNTIFRRLVQDSLISGMHWNVQRCKGASLRVQTISDATLKEIKLQHAHHNSESPFQLTSKCGYSTPVHMLLLIFGGVICDFGTFIVRQSAINVPGQNICLCGASLCQHSDTGVGDLVSAFTKKKCFYICRQECK